MSLFRQDSPPPPQSWDTLREWLARPWRDRFLASLRVMLPFTSIVMALAAIAMYIAEPSWRSIRLVLVLWLIGIPLTALGYMRRIDRMARQVPPITAASRNPTTAVDIRGKRQD